MADKNTIKNWFLTGLKPTQAQFSATWDSFWHKDEKIPITAIEDIENILNEKADAEALQNHVTTETAHADLFDGKEDKTNKGIAGGYVPLNEFVKIAIEYLNVVNDLVTGGATSLLTAEQGVVLQTQIDNINILLTSDNVNLDNVQELVDAIETVQTSLSTILVNDLTTGGTMKALTAEMGKLLNENVIHKTGDEDIDGIKNFSNDVKGKKFITAGGTSNHYIRGDGELGVFDDTISRNIIKDVTQSAAVTGTVSEVLLKTYLIPANTFKVEDVMHIKEFSTFEPISENQSNRIRLRIGATNNFSTSAIILESYLSLTTQYNRVKSSSSHSIRDGLIANVATASSITNDIGRSKLTYIPFDPTVDNYLFSSIQLILSSSSISQLALIVTN